MQHMQVISVGKSSVCFLSDLPFGAKEDNIIY